VLGGNFPEVKLKEKPRSGDIRNGKRKLMESLNKFYCPNCEDMGYTIIRCGGEIVGAIDCDCEYWIKR
jgi:predicted RNA-binding Zn-ribbon protein involved in translation (DUF1610 family)